MKERQLLRWVALSVIAGLVLIGVFIWQLPTTSDQWAAWVQAFGSIGALLAAFYLSRRQLSDAFAQQLSLKELDRQKQMEAYAAVISLAMDNAKSMVEAHENQAPEIIFRLSWDISLEASSQACIKAMDEIPLYEFGSSEAVLHASTIKNEFAAIRALLEMKRHGRAPQPNTFGPMTHSVDWRYQFIDRAYQQFQEAIAKLHGS